MKQRSARDWFWILTGLAIVVALAFGLRFGTNVLDQPEIRDEALMKAPIDDILEQGWSVETAIDYQEVKGPVFFWSYALPGEVLGGGMNAMRLVSMLLFVFGVIPLLLIAVRVGIRGPALLVVAILYALLPYNAFVAQLLMSEPSFVFVALWMLYFFVWGFDAPPGDARRVWGPILFGLMLSVLLHHRPQAVAFAGAVVLTAAERDRLRAWPWALAAVLAGLSRLPLWVRWGGLVTSDYNELFGFGVRPEGLTYLLAAALPATAVFLWPALVESRHRARRWWVAVGAAAGLLAGLFARPDLDSRVHYVLRGEPEQQREFAGVIGTALEIVSNSPMVHAVLLTILAALGGASLAALASVTWERRADDADGATRRLAFWTLTVGIPLYIVTSGPVYDRYLMIWFVLLPIVWQRTLPPAILAVQMAALACMLAYLVNSWLM